MVTIVIIFTEIVLKFPGQWKLLKGNASSTAISRNSLFLLEKTVGWTNQGVKCRKIGSQNCLCNWATYERVTCVKRYIWKSLIIPSIPMYTMVLYILLFVKYNVSYFKTSYSIKAEKHTYIQTIYFILRE